jgi:stage IV sporulation protein FB
MRRPHAEATRIAARIGQGAAFLFALAGLFINPMLIVIGLFIYVAASAEAQHVATRDVAREMPVRAGMVTLVETLAPTATLDDAVTCLIRTSQKEFPVVDGAGRPRGLVTRDNLIPALRDGGPATPVLEVMAREIPTIGAQEPLERGLVVLSTTRAPALFVLDPEGRLVGLLTPENVGELMMVRSVRPDWPLGGMRARPS